MKLAVILLISGFLATMKTSSLPPIHLCDPDSPSFSRKIPLPITCSTLEQTGRFPPKPVAFSTLKPKVDSLSIKATFCQKLQYKSTCFKNFFGAITLNNTHSNLVMYEEECKELEGNLNNQDKTIWLGQKIDAECYWMTTTEVVSEVISVTRTSIIIDRDNNKVEHGFPIMSPCNYLKNECHDKKGILIWNRTESTSLCPLTVDSHYQGTITWDSKLKEVFLISQKHHMILTFKDIKELKDIRCHQYGMWYLSDQGILVVFHGPKTGSFLELTSFAISSSSWTKNVVRLNASSVKPLLALSMDLAEVNWALNSINEANTHLLLSQERQLCEVYNTNWNIAWGLRHIAPDVSVQIFTQTSFIRGILSGSYIIYQECKELKTWTPVLQDGQCGDYYKLLEPVGFCVEGLNMRAIRCPKKCPPSGRGTLIKVNKTHVIELNDPSRTPLPDSSFYSRLSIPSIPLIDVHHVMISPSELAQSSHVLHILDQLSNQVSLINNQILGLSSSQGVDSSMIGTPSFFTNLGFIAGKISTLGGTIWIMVLISGLGIWVVLMIKVFLALCTRDQLSKRRKRRQPKRKTPGPQPENEIRLISLA